MCAATQPNRTREAGVRIEQDPGTGGTDSPRGAIIFGCGKSGTKRLLRIMDLSRRTHCRNEPYNLHGSPFQGICVPPLKWILGPGDEEELERRWDGALQWSKVRMGELDFIPSPPKDHLHPFARRVGLLHLLGRRRVRRMLGLIARPLRNEEWLVPRWIGNPEILRRSSMVVKINQAPAVATWVLRHRPEDAVIHLVRHPAGALCSWAVRHLAFHDPERVRCACVAKLRVIAENDGSWAQLFGDLESLSVEEAELWFWRYVGETIHAAGLRSDRYVLVRDEDIVRDPVTVAQTVFRCCGLEWETEIEEELRRWAPHWRACSSRWRDLIRDDQIEMIERIFGDSPMAEWWSEEPAVSGVDYEWRGLGTTPPPDTA